MGPAKIVARFADGRVIKGHTSDFSPTGARFHLAPTGNNHGRRPLEVRMTELKAVFFVRDFAGDPSYSDHKHFAGDHEARGRKVVVMFADGEVLPGYTMGFDAARPGFFVFPTDPRSNNLRVFAVSSAVRQVLSPTDPPAPAAPGAAGGEPPMIDVEQIGDLRATVATLRQTVADWEGVARAVETLSREHETLRARHEQTDRAYQDLQAEHARIRAAHEEAVQTVVRLRSIQEALRQEHDAGVRALQELRKEHDALLLERRAAADDIEAVLRRLHV